MKHNKHALPFYRNTQTRTHLNDFSGGTDPCKTGKGEDVVISHCMLNSKTSAGAGVGNNLSSQCDREAQASEM